MIIEVIDKDRIKEGSINIIVFGFKSYSDTDVEVLCNRCGKSGFVTKRTFDIQKITKAEFVCIDCMIKQLDKEENK